ncbi:MAG: branched-chain amino acid ABC transporter permease, partial [Synergistaceae bacterium]|nr:branched-chain amino acid ABC transporter permease [Synergistaceae bacterium]
VLGGQGNMLGGIIAAAVLTILPEKLRSFSEYRMLLYAVVLIVMMLATNNSEIKEFLSGLNPFRRKEEAK